MSLPAAYTAPAFEAPHRVLVLAASTDGWYAASAAEKSATIDGLRLLFEQAVADGARLVGSFDDDLLATGQPTSLSHSIFVLLDVDALDVVVRLVHAVRSSDLGRHIRLEARVGRPLLVLDR